MAVNVARAMIPVPAASPSTPSARFTPLTAPAMITNSSTYHAGPSQIHLSAIGTKTAWRRCWWWAAKPTATVTPRRSTIFQRPLNPRERRWRSFVQSSRNPIAPQAIAVPKIVSAGVV
jgi:hypothetical protein